MKQIPLVMTDFAKIRQQGQLYIDKTEYLNSLQKQGKYFIFLRPNRFAKSLFISTLQHWLERKKALFEGLWIEDKTDWTQSHAVLVLDFKSLELDNLENSLTAWIKKQAENAQINLVSEDFLEQTGELIQKIAQNKPLALLIDNYDLPITHFLQNSAILDQNKQILASFYAQIYSVYDHLSFFWLTGVAHLGQFSFWQDLSFCEDITFDPSFTTLAGFTTDEMNFYAKDELRNLATEHPEHDIWALIESFYKGFSWNGRDMMYNPFTMMNLLEYQQFRNYWYDPQVAWALASLLPKQNYPVYQLENIVLDLPKIDQAKLLPLDTIEFLFRSGYLTIREKNIVNQIVILDYPNKKIQEGFYKDLLLAYTQTNEDDLTEYLFKCSHNLLSSKISDFIDTLNLFFQKLNHQDFPKKEAYFYSIFYLIIKALEKDWQANILSTRRRIDAACQTEHALYLMQFKIASTESILEKLKEKNYLSQMKEHTEAVYFLAISFDAEHIKIADFRLEQTSLADLVQEDELKGASL